MAHSFLIFDFGTNEDAAQQARHKIEGWKQAFRLGNKILLKFERDEVSQASESKDSKSEPDGKAQGKSTKSGKAAKSQKDEEGKSNAQIHVLIRLDFSDHEKLSRQRWLERIPGEEPFKSAQTQTVRQGDPDFAKTSDRFDSLD
jgi:hypothetical protein